MTYQPVDLVEGLGAGRAPRLAIRAVPALLRINQWPKNGLVLAGPLAATALTGDNAATPREGAVALAITLGCWCLVSSAAYIINDLNDRAADRLHPEKRHRPLASGAIGARTGLAIAAATALVGLAAGLAVSPSVAALLATYLTITANYSTWAKTVPIVELLMVAAGFPLRALSGIAAVGLAVTPWFMLVISSAALFVVTSKRLSEIRRLGDRAGGHRAVLDEYSERFLSQTQTLAIAFFLAVYCIWSISGAALPAELPGIVQLSLLPVVLIVLRFALQADRGLVDRPETLLYTDRFSQIAGVLWLVLFVVGVRGL